MNYSQRVKVKLNVAKQVVFRGLMYYYLRMSECYACNLLKDINPSAGKIGRSM